MEELLRIKCSSSCHVPDTVLHILHAWDVVLLGIWWSAVLAAFARRSGRNENDTGNTLDLCVVSEELHGTIFRVADSVDESTRSVPFHSKVQSRR